MHTNAQNYWFQSMKKIPSTCLDLEINKFAGHCVLPRIWRAMMTLMPFYCMSKQYKSCKYLTTKLLSLSGRNYWNHGAYSTLSVNFYQGAVGGRLFGAAWSLPLNSCWSGLLPREFCFQYLCGAGNCLPWGIQVNLSASESVCHCDFVAYGNKGFFGDRELCKGCGGV